MTKLEKAFAEASKLPKEEQELFASWILEEIASERQWTDRFATSHDRLSNLAEGSKQERLTGYSSKTRFIPAFISSKYIRLNQFSRLESAASTGLWE